MGEEAVMMQPSSPTGLRSLMEQFGLYPKKRWGQNFLIDRNILGNIAQSSGGSPDLYMIEIGPGMGALTQRLAECSQGVLAIDIDASLEGPLREVLSPFDNVRLYFADVLEVDLESELIRQFDLDTVSAYVVCANIPYNITTPIIFKLLEKCPHMKSATLMMQKEVADRILASPGNKDYGLLTLMTRYYADVRPVMKVSRNCFYPRPEVDSSVIQFIPLGEPRVKVSDEQTFKSFLKRAFQMRRKTILNCCTQFFGLEKSDAQARLNQINIESNRRPEELSLEVFAELVETFSR